MKKLWNDRKKMVPVIVLLLVITAGAVFLIAGYRTRAVLKNHVETFEKQIEKDGFAEVKEYQDVLENARTALQNGNWRDIWIMNARLGKTIKAEHSVKKQCDTLHKDLSAYEKEMKKYALDKNKLLIKVRTEASSVLAKKQISLFGQTDKKLLQYCEKTRRIGKIISPVKENGWEWNENIRRYSYFNEAIKDEWKEKQTTYQECLQELDEKTLEQAVKDLSDDMTGYEEKYAPVLEKQMEADKAYMKLLLDRQEALRYDDLNSVWDYTEYGYLLIDCDGDSIKELLEYMLKGTEVIEQNLYAYRDGKLVELEGRGDVDDGNDNSYYLDVENHKLIHIRENDSDEIQKLEISSLKNGKAALQDVAEYDEEYLDDDSDDLQNKYLLNDEEITEEEYHEWCDSVQKEIEGSCIDLDYTYWPEAWKEQKEPVHEDSLSEELLSLYPRIPNADFEYTGNGSDKIKIVEGKYSEEDQLGADLDGDGVKDQFAAETGSCKEGGAAFCFNGKHYISPDPDFYGEGGLSVLFQFPDGQSVILVGSTGDNDWPDGNTLVSFKNGKAYRIPCDKLSKEPCFDVCDPGEDYVVLRYLNNRFEGTGNFLYERKLYFRDGKAELGAPGFFSKDCQRTWTVRRKFQVYQDFECVKKAFQATKGMRVKFITYEGKRIKIKTEDGKTGWFQDEGGYSDPLFKGTEYAG